MTTRPFAGDQPPSATLVWLALDSYEIRPFSRLVASLLATRLARLGRAWKKRTATESERQLVRKRARKWADVTTSRGLAWLTAHGRARKIGGGYLRVRPQVETEMEALLEVCVEVEQRLRGLRTIWSINPNYPERERHGGTLDDWRASLDQLLSQLDAVARGIRTRRRGMQPAGRGALSREHGSDA